MQSVLFYGRLFSRAFANGVYSATTNNSAPISNTPHSSCVPHSSANASSPAAAQAAPCRVVREVYSQPRILTAVSGYAKSQQTLEHGRTGKFGDDAYFVTRHHLGDVIGVADGVGGWRAWGIDPGEFSYKLMRSCERLVEAGAFSPSDPASLLATAYRELLQNKSHVLGSSTACLVVVQATEGAAPTDSISSDSSSTCVNTRSESSREDNIFVESPSHTGSCSAKFSSRLTSANIGDSGYLVVRGGIVVHRSREQQHYFNTPFQLSLPPPGTSAHVLNDSPESAEVREFLIEAGDLLLVATDGVFDNLPVSSILQELAKVAGTKDLSDLQRAANDIAQQARKLAFDESYMSPFALNARQNGINATGGKPDDITVVLAAVLD